jgi:hypothetical protein
MHLRGVTSCTYRLIAQKNWRTKNLLHTPALLFQVVIGFAIRSATRFAVNLATALCEDASHDGEQSCEEAAALVIGYASEEVFAVLIALCANPLRHFVCICQLIEINVVTHDPHIYILPL